MFRHLPDIALSQSTQLSSEPAVNTVRFGLGYNMRAPASLYPVQRRWLLKWEYLNRTDSDRLDQFFSDHAGHKAFFWSPPNLPGRGLYLCSSWQVIPQLEERYHLSARFISAI